MRFSSAGYETSTAVSIASGWIGPIASPTTAMYIGTIAEAPATKAWSSLRKSGPDAARTSSGSRSSRSTPVSSLTVPSAV